MDSTGKMGFGNLFHHQGTIEEKNLAYDSGPLFIWENQAPVIGRAWWTGGGGYSPGFQVSRRRFGCGFKQAAGIWIQWKQHQGAWGEKWTVEGCSGLGWLKMRDSAAFLIIWRGLSVHEWRPACEVLQSPVDDITWAWTRSCAACSDKLYRTNQH